MVNIRSPHLSVAHTGMWNAHTADHTDFSEKTPFLCSPPAVPADLWPTLKRTYLHLFGDTGVNKSKCTQLQCKGGKQRSANVIILKKNPKHWRAATATTPRCCMDGGLLTVLKIQDLRLQCMGMAIFIQKKYFPLHTQDIYKPYKHFRGYI